MLHAIDTRPTLQGLQQYEVLSAEAEMLTGFKSEGGASTAICRWYGTVVGRNGKNCRMIYSQFEDKTLRCWT